MRIRLISYEGWSEAIELTNDTVRLVVVPSIGRILHYGLCDGANLLWVNPDLAGKVLADITAHPEREDAPWANFGGDKVWPIEQSRWPEVNGRPWPPDPWFDGSPHVYTVRDRGIRLVGPLSPWCGARLVRDIALDQAGSRVSLRYRMEKRQPALHADCEPLGLTIWSVTQIRTPERIELPCHPHSRLPGGVCFLLNPENAEAHWHREGRLGLLTPSEREHLKVGTDGDGWIAARFGTIRFVQQFRRGPMGTHPDGDLSAEAYTSPEGYAELEILSPQAALLPGESFTWHLTWTLEMLP